MKKALIFGVTGQDGSYLAELLLKEGYRVIGVARRTSLDSSRRLHKALQNARFQLVRGDVTDAGNVLRLLYEIRPDEVYNLAAQSHVGDSFQEPAHTTAVVYGGCLNILEGVRILEAGSPAGTPRMRVYQASSSEMFGSAFSIRTRMTPKHPHYGRTKAEVAADTFFLELDSSWYEDEWFQNEQTPFEPNSPYAIAKLAAHGLCRVYRESYGLFVCSGILFNHESPRRPETFVTRKVTRWAAQTRQRWDQGLPGAPLQLGNLDACRDWGFAGDYVRAMWLMLQQDVPDDYVVATGQTHSVRELVEEAMRAAGVNMRVEDAVEVSPTLKRPCEVPYLRGDASKARRVLGWEPTESFRSLVSMMVQADYEEEHNGAIL